MSACSRASCRDGSRRASRAGARSRVRRSCTHGPLRPLRPLRTFTTDRARRDRARAARRQTRAPPPPRHMFAVSSTRVVVNAANTSGTKRVAGKKAAAGKVRRAPLGFILKPSRPRPRSRPRGARGGARDARSTRARDARDRRARAIDRPRGRARDAAIGERTATRRSIDRATSGGVDAGSRTVDREIGAREETEGETKANANARLTDDATARRTRHSRAKRRDSSIGCSKSPCAIPASSAPGTKTT